MTLPAFFFFFEISNKRVHLRVNKTDITSENDFNGDLFEINNDHEYSKDEKSWFEVFCRFATRALNHRPQNAYIYLFRALFAFCSF